MPEEWDGVMMIEALLSREYGPAQVTGQRLSIAVCALVVRI